MPSNAYNSGQTPWWMQPISATNRPPGAQQTATNQALQSTATTASNSTISNPYAGWGSYGTGGNNAGAFAGFDFGQADANRDVGKSAKYAFANAAGRAGTTPRTKDEAQSWFSKYISPYLQSLGYSVYGVEGDKARVGTRENPGGEWIDFLQNAGGDNPMLAWQSDVGEGPGASMYGQFGGPTATTASYGTLGSTIDLNTGSSVDRIAAMWNQLSPEQQQQIVTAFGLTGA